MNMKRIFTGILAILMSISIFTGCQKNDSKDAANNTTQSAVQSTPQVKIVESLKLEGGVDWGMPNPYLCDARGPGVSKMKFVFDSLLESNEKSDIPWLAKEWKIEGNQYTFTIYDNAVFHDGKKLTTADIAFTMDYYKKYPPVSDSLKAEKATYQIVDDYKIVITVEKPTAATLINLGSFPILPKHIWEKVTDPKTFKAPEAFIGSGIFSFGKYDSATGSYEFLANTKHCSKTAAAKKLMFVPVSDPVLAFENDEIDIATVPVDLMSKYKSNAAIGFLGKDNDMGYKLMINMKKYPEFLDLALRKALYTAIDRQKIVDTVFRGSGAVASAGYVPQTNAFYSDQVIKYDYNKDAAKSVLSGKNLTMSILAGTGDDIKIAELVKNDLEVAGIKASVTSVDTKVRDSKVFAGEYDLALVGNGGWGREPSYLRTLYSDKSKFTGTSPHFMGPLGYSNVSITDLAEKTLFETDFTKRKELYKSLQNEIGKEIPILPLVTQTTQVMYKKDYYSGWMKTYDYQQLEQVRMSYVIK